EAVEIRRRLAQRNPDAFLPDLATSLGAHGSVLRGLERYAEAVESFGDGVRVLTPFFLRLSQAFTGLMGALVSEYLNACQAAGQEPDGELLGPVLELLQGPADGEDE
ncbi:MAG: hypothetical protein ACE5E7_19710, partial [Anaerolineae bacterium]